jgi:hypothetical protein
MAIADKPTSTEAGLRCHDAHHGLSNVDSHSGYIAELDDVREVGMAANLAVNIRGRDVIGDADALKVIAAEELGVEPLLFKTILDLLQHADFVTVHKSGSKRSIEERVPVHENLYDRLGQVWEERHPSELQEEMISVVNSLASTPILLDEAKEALPDSDLDTILAVGGSTELIKNLELDDGTTLLYSPYFAFEHPERLQGIFESHEIEEVRAAMAKLRGEQGLLVDESDPALADMVSRGLVMTPTIAGAGGDARFAFLPYAADPQVLRVEKSVLDKAVQILACVRYGQHRAVKTKISMPAAILNRLLDPSHDFTLGAHSEHRQQYFTLYRLGIVDFIPSHNWVKVKLIDTEDNKRAVRLALDLLRYGEEMTDKGTNEAAQELLAHGERLHGPLRTIKDRRDAAPRLPAQVWAGMVEAARGGVAI